MASAVVADETTLTPVPVDERNFVVHLSPVWRERANFIVDADIEEEGSPRRFEQFWVRQLGKVRFEVCCIPFFVYDLALGDEVETRAQGERLYVIERVVKASGRYTFRAWFGDSTDPGVRDDVIEAMRGLGSEFEWYSDNLLAIDAADDECAQQVADFLHGREQLGRLTYETGRSG
jgi:hypothetical protein